MADIELTAPDGHTFHAYEARPTTPPVAAVVVVQEVFGVNHHIRHVVDQVAEAGYLAIAPSVFDRVERGVELGYDGEGITKGRAIAWEQLPLDDALTDVAAAADAVAAEVGGPARVGIVGFCYGGMLTCAALSRVPERFAGGVAYYPSQAATLLTDDRPARPLLIHLGDQDQGVTVEDGQTLTRRWPEAESYRYPNAGHGFNCDERPGFDAEAAAQAWERTLTFLARHLDA